MSTASKALRKTLMVLADEDKRRSPLDVGRHARSQSLERGEILSGEKNRIESSKFTGNHFVEIYVVSQQTVIARNYIKVPIDALNEFNK